MDTEQLPYEYKQHDDNVDAIRYATYIDKKDEFPTYSLIMFTTAMVIFVIFLALIPYLFHLSP